MQRLYGISLASLRLPDAQQKLRILNAVERARQPLPPRQALRVLGLTPSRYHAWTRKERDCALDAQTACPKTGSQSLTFNEVRQIGDMVESADHRHMSVRALALHAQRMGRVFSPPTTWARLIKERG